MVSHSATFRIEEYEVNHFAHVSNVSNSTSEFGIEVKFDAGKFLLCHLECIG
jgi:hypothetical protein